MKVAPVLRGEVDEATPEGIARAPRMTTVIIAARLARAGTSLRLEEGVLIAGDLVRPVW